MHVWGSLVFFLFRFFSFFVFHVPVTIINCYMPQDMVEAHKVFDNYRRDLFIQYVYGLTYEAHMDQLIVAPIDCESADQYLDVT